MKGSYLGEFEEIILLLVAKLAGDAYGLAIRTEFMEQTGRSAAIGAVHSALSRLEKKGFLDSRLGDPSGERGGRRKRIFRMTASGKSAVEHSRVLRNNLWDQISALTWKEIKMSWR